MRATRNDRAARILDFGSTTEPVRTGYGMRSENLLELAPERVAEWREDRGRIVVDRPAPASPWRAPLAWLSYKLSTKRVRLDEVGSFVWKLLDGRRTVAEIAAAMRTEFGERVEPVEERLGEMIRILQRGELVEYRRPEDPDHQAAAMS